MFPPVLVPGAYVAVVAFADVLNPNNIYPGLVHSPAVGTVTPLVLRLWALIAHTG